jgi:hypothetical protein
MFLKRTRLLAALWKLSFQFGMIDNLQFRLLSDFNVFFHEKKFSKIQFKAISR